MEIIGLGTDIIEIERIKKAIERTKSFKEKVFSADEIEYAEKRKDSFCSYAGKFSAKEAISKAFGTGVRGFNLKDIEILNDEMGKPYAKFSDKFREKMKEKLKKTKIEISISHCKNYAIATAIIFSI